MSSTAVTNPTIPDPTARKQIEELSHQKLTTCYQCQKCSNGCPMSFAMDIAPHRVMRLLQLGMVDPVLSSETIWVCASCQTCTTRCPNDIDITHVMETLRKASQMLRKPNGRNAERFNSEFLASVKAHGRLFELGMITRYTLMSEGVMGLVRQTGLAYAMFIRGKLRLLPHTLFPNKEVKQVFEQAEERGGDKQ